MQNAKRLSRMPRTRLSRAQQRGQLREQWLIEREALQDGNRVHRKANEGARVDSSQQEVVLDGNLDLTDRRACGEGPRGSPDTQSCCNSWEQKHDS